MMNNTMLEKLQSKHTTLEGMKMLVITWNVNAKLEERANLRKLFFNPEEKSIVGNVPEIIVLGLQEMVELSTSNVIGGNMVGNSAERVEQWKTMLLQVLREHNKSYEMVTSRNMVGLWITVFALREFREDISKIQVSSLGRGVGGVLGNKGAVYARFNIRDTSICLVCAHFAAHREHLQKRNEDFHAILNFKAFPGLLDDIDTSELPNLSPHNNIHMANEAARCVRIHERIAAMKRTLAAHKIAVAPPLQARQELHTNFTSALDHDIIIWLGDLNYRLISGMENSRIYDYIDGKRAYVLQTMDQLLLEKEKGTVFQGFHEGLITFDPTYKYIPGSLGYNRERTPAWCDRILWRLNTPAVSCDEELEIFTPPPSIAAAAEAVIDNESEGDGGTEASSPLTGTVDANTAEMAVSDCSTPVPVSPLTPSTPVPIIASPSTSITTTSAPVTTITAPLNTTVGVAVATELLSPDEEMEVQLQQEEHCSTRSSTLSQQDVSIAAGIEHGVVESGATLTNTFLNDANQLQQTTNKLPSIALPIMPQSERIYLHSLPEPKALEIVELMLYNRAENLISDHKPVRALMGIKYKTVDWAAHEQHLLSQYAQRCEGRPYHTQSFQTLHGVAPVTFTPRIVVLQSSAPADTSYGVVLHNHSTANTVRFEVCNELASLPWLSINPVQGIMAPGECYALEVHCYAEEAERLYMSAIEEDALHIEDELRQVWRRHLRNADERGNPQVTATLRVNLFTHLNADLSSGGSDSGNSGIKNTSVAGVVGATDAVSTAGSPCALPPQPCCDSSLVSADKGAGTGCADREGDIGAQCVVSMSPLLVPVVCRIGAQ